MTDRLVNPFESQITQVERVFMDYYHDTDKKFKASSNNHGLQVSLLQPEGSFMPCVKGEMTVDITIEEFLSIFLCISLRQLCARVIIF